jgi:hypothetical protein
MLNELIAGQTRESISLSNRVVIEVHTASFRTTRGYSIIAALLDEVAYLAHRRERVAAGCGSVECHRAGHGDNP